MYIVFDQKFYKVYDSDPAAEAGRLQPIITELGKHPHYKFVAPTPAEPEHILLAHSRQHFENEQSCTNAYNMAMLAAGGAIMAAGLAIQGKPSFACIRPPGHHASRNSAWGYCIFNNMAISILRLKQAGTIKSAIILDIDLHYGDGTADIFQEAKWVTIHNPNPRQPENAYIKEIKHILQTAAPASIIAISAGFDNYIKDWGGTLSTSSYQTIGEIAKEYAEKKTNGRRYALLEGGYYKPDIGTNVHAFCEGFR